MSDQPTADENGEESITDSIVTDDDPDEHIITKIGLAQYKTTFKYDEEQGNLVHQGTEMGDNVNPDSASWSCNCGEIFTNYPGAASHAEVFSEDER